MTDAAAAQVDLEGLVQSDQPRAAAAQVITEPLVQALALGVRAGAAQMISEGLVSGHRVGAAQMLTEVLVYMGPIVPPPRPAHKPAFSAVFYPQPGKRR
jgi:hypothetical protein